MSSPERMTITVSERHRVAALLDLPADARACYVFAHGAGAGMEHPGIADLAAGLAERGVATLRYQFPYMERRLRRPDPPQLCHATVRAAVAQAARVAPSLPLVAGGRSFGGRMTSQAQAIEPLADVRGLVFFAFPLHPAGKPSDERARHLFQVKIPMLFLQGTRDELASLSLLEPLIGRLGDLATLKRLEDADHSFRVRAGSGRGEREVLDEALDAFAAWLATVAPDGSRRV